MLDVAAIPGLQAAFRDVQDANPGARARAAASLGRAGPEEAERAASALRGLLQDPQPEVRHAAALSLGEIKDLSSLPRLVEQMRSDQDSMARQAAAIALGELGDPSAAGPLAEMLAQGPPDVRFQAVISLTQVAPEAAAGPLREALHDPDSGVRGNAVAALGDLGDASAADALAALLEDPVESVRVEAAVSLARLGDGRGTPTLTERLDDREYSLLAAEHLFHHPSQEAVPALRRALGRWFASPLLKVWAAGALVRLGHEDGRARLASLLQSGKPTVRGLAIEVLGELQQPWAVAALQELAGSPAGQRWSEEISEALAPR